MKCPRCQSEVKWIESGVDSQPIRICENPECKWEELPLHERALAHFVLHPIKAEELRYHGKSAF